MPVKKRHDLKDRVDREAGRVWSEALDIPELTTREIDYATDHRQADKSDGEISQEIQDHRHR